MDEVVTCERGHYFIENEVTIMGTSFFIAQDKKSKKPYMVGEKQASSYMTKYGRLAVTADYVSALEEWNRRLSEAIENLKPQQVIRT